MRISRKFLVVVLFGVFMALVSGEVAAQSVLDKVKETGTIAIGMREDARPFAYLDAKGNVVGFSIDFAWLMVKKLAEYAGREITVTEVPVIAPTRIPLLVAGTIDIEMSSTTITGPRDAVVDFTIPFFISETTFMVRVDAGIKRLADLNGKIVSSARGTTNLKALQEIVERGVIKPLSLIIVESHSEGLLALEMGKIDAYFTDTSLLMGLRASAKNPEAYEIILEPIHAEPYGWMVRENDPEWRDWVNWFLIWTLQTPCINAIDTLKELGILTECKDPTWTIYDAIYDKWLGPDAEVHIPRSPDFDAYLKVISKWPGILEVWPKPKG